MLGFLLVLLGVSMASALGEKIYIGNRRVTGSDVQKLVAGNGVAFLDPAALERVVSTVASSDVAAVIIMNASDVKLELPLARAAAVGVLVQLMHGKAGVRPVVVEALSEALNTPSSPMLSSLSSSNPAVAIASALQGKIDLQSHEVAAITTGHAAAAGMLVLTIAATRSLCVIADGIAALSAEATRTPLAAFDSELVELRPHAGQLASANALRLLLEGSSQCTAKPSDGSSDPAVDAQISAVAGSYQLHGTARDVISNILRTAVTELNAVHTSSGSHSQPLALLAQQAFACLGLIAAAAVKRSGGVGTPAFDWSVALSDEPAAAAVTTFSALRAAQTALSGEASWSCAVLAKLQETWQAEGSKTLDRKAAAAAAKAAEMAAAEAALPEAERLKLEAKRKKQAAKQSAKEAAGGPIGGGKKSGGTANTFGKGSNDVLALLLASGAAAAVDSTGSSGLLFAAGIDAAVEKLSSGGERRKVKIPKGTRDYMPEQMEVRQRCFQTIRSVFKRHGAVEIDTPVFELKETLLGKYGEEGGKLIYDLADQGGELLSLRYDLTVPFARFIAMHNCGNIKRYHIARVYRRDNPAINRGRFREFYQCDYDIAGDYPSGRMMPDAEVLKVACEVLTDLEVGRFQIKLNHRGLLDAILALCGVPDTKFRTICSAIDKLDKEPWADVREEMVSEKGLSPESADAIGTFVAQHGRPADVLAWIKSHPALPTHALAKPAVEDLTILFQYLDAMGCIDSIEFDLSLARGLDYYTGVIYEAVLIEAGIPVGSIAAGGRYDNLVGAFSTGKVPCVGVSIGIERVFAIMEQKASQSGGLKTTPVQVLVASAGKGLTLERMKVARELWAAGISCEMEYHDNPKPRKQIESALEAGIPFMVTIGESEIAAGTVNLKDLAKSVEVPVPRVELVDRLRTLLGSVSASSAAVMASASGVPAAPVAARGVAVPDSVTVEGTDRACGRFARPKVSIL